MGENNQLMTSIEIRKKSKEIAEDGFLKYICYKKPIEIL